MLDMKKAQNVLVLLPNQLFAPDLLPQADVVYVVEEPLFFGADQQYPFALHKQKLVLHRASMRRYVEEALWPAGINVEYIELKDIGSTAEILFRAKSAGAEMVQIFDPNDHTIESRLKVAIEESIEPPFELRVLPSPNFYLQRGEAQQFFADKSSHSFATFYQWQRERFNILIDKKFKPVGGSWMHEPKERKALPVDYVAPGFESFGDNKYVAEARKWVEEHFTDNPGSLEHFLWPTSSVEARAALDDFLRNRLADFATYQDAIDGQGVMLYHSGLSAALDCGLINPQEVIATTLAYVDKHTDLSLDSVEGFVRRILGWREYVRAIYVAQHSSMRSASQERLAEAWLTSTTGLPPVDDVISKVDKNAYVHGAERLMVAGNAMLLCEEKPEAIYAWYMSMFIDAYDWSVTPNVFAMTHFTDLGGMITKPYISSSAYVRTMSHYPEGEWCNIWDGLFWGFVERHHELLAKNPHTSTLAKGLSRIDADRRRIIDYRAQDFLNTIH